jgi:hypothetical protein
MQKPDPQNHPTKPDPRPASFGQQQKFIPPNHHKQIFPINPLNLYQISQPNRSTQQQIEPNQPSYKQPRKFFMAIFGMADLVLWWVGVANLSPWRVVVSDLVQWVDMGFAASGIQRSWWAEVANGGGVQWREERGKILRGVMWCFVLILIVCNKLRCQLLIGWQKTHVFCHIRIEVILIYIYIYIYIYGYLYLLIFLGYLYI